MNNWDEFDREHVDIESIRARGRMFLGLVAVVSSILAAVAAAVYAYFKYCA